MDQHMLSTIDNPYNPFHQFDEWLAWDQSKQYYTQEFLARVVRTSNDLSDGDEDAVLEDAIDEIVRENVLGLYIKVTADTQVPR